MKSLTVFFLLLFFVNLGFSQKNIQLLISKIDSTSKGDTLFVEVLGNVNCSSETPVEFGVNYSFSKGLFDNGKWITWKQKYLDCEDFAYVQQFYAPVCSVFQGSKDFFKEEFKVGMPFK